MPSRLGVLLGVLLMVSAAQAAPPEVPQSLTYQGVLLDDQGQPRSGVVALTLRVYDALFAGALVYKQEFPTVGLVDGIFTVVLGPSGSSSDVPTDPLTTDLAEALAGEVGPTGPGRFLEVTVGSDGPLARTQILTVPYALRAAEADNAANAGGVAGFSSSVFEQIVQNSNLDDTGPLNGDPREGFGDTDNDGLANFVDPDNDNDTILDGVEVTKGSDMNLVTPVLSSVSPALGFALLTHTVTLSGQNFDPGVTVAFGTENPTPSISSPMSMDVLVGPQSAGAVDIQLTLPNGEQAFAAAAFDFLNTVLHAINFQSSARLGFSVRGQADLVVSGGQQYQLPLRASPNTFAWPWKHALGEGDVALSPSGVLAGIRCREISAVECHVEIAVDDDADLDLTDETGILVATLDFDTATHIERPTLDFDSSGHVAAGFYFSNLFHAVAVVHDRNGDSVITQAANELVFVDLNVGTTPRVAFELDASDRAALLYSDDADDALHLAWDRSGDGDFADSVSGTPELAAWATGVPTVNCLGVGFAPDGDPVAVYASPTAGTVFLRDQDQDGGVGGPGESLVLSAVAATVCALEADDGPVAVFHDLSNRMNLLVDRDDDGDFDGVDETVDLGAASNLRGLALDRNADGIVMLATSFSSGPGAVLFDPTP